MRFVGIDIGAERHSVAVVDQDGAVLNKSVFFEEGAAGYRRLGEVLGSPMECLIAIETTGHYWENLFAWLTSKGFAIALLNPLRTRRFAEEELQRTKTDKSRRIRYRSVRGPEAAAAHEAPGSGE